MLSDLHNMQLIHKYIVLGLEYFMPTAEHTGTVSQNPSRVYLVATSWAARPVMFSRQKNTDTQILCLYNHNQKPHLFPCIYTQSIQTLA